MSPRVFRAKLQYIMFKSRTKHQLMMMRWRLKYTFVGLLISNIKDDFTWDKLFKFFGLLALSSVILITILTILF